MDKLSNFLSQTGEIPTTLHVTINAPVVLGFVAICLLATLLSVMTQGRSNQLFFMTYRSSILNPLTYVRLVTHVFGHSGFEHFMGNMCYILLLGPLLEEKYSSRTLLLVILITAVVTALVNNIFFPHIGISGASGIVFAFIILSSFTGFREGEIPLTFILVAVFFLGQQVMKSAAGEAKVSHMAHILGGILGGVMGFYLNM